MKNIIRLDRAAISWDEGLPLGNGRLGIMLTGGVQEDVIPLNEETVWYGGARERTNPDAYGWFKKTRELLIQGRAEDAEFYSRMAFSSCPKYLMPFVPLGNLRLSFPDQREYTNYRRELDIDKASATVAYQCNQVIYERTVWVAKEPNVIVFRFRASEKGKLRFSAHLERRPFEENSTCLPDECTQTIWGRNGADGVQYFCAASLVTVGGRSYSLGDFLVAEDADEAYLFISAETDFGNRHDYREHCLSQIHNALKMEYELLKDLHEKWYCSLFDRCSIDINHVVLPDEPTDILLERVRNTADDSLTNALTALLFQFGRYLLISCSTDCQLPANLQGIWNGTYQPPWESKYTININIQMNYWPAEVCALSECHMPLFSLVDRMVVRGKETAKRIYNCPGFVSHHNTDLWANTDPESITASAMLWPMSGAWFALHYFEHYLFTLDKDFLLSRALPVMRESLRFFDSYLYRSDDGTLWTGPSLSPENVYKMRDGQRASVCMSPTMDNQILRQLCEDYIEACRITGQSDEIVERAKEISRKLPPTIIGPDGRIQEWLEPYDEIETGHRHISHLFGVFPGTEITDDKPEMQEAAYKTLEKRLSAGGGHTGWSRAWIICLYARLKKADHALENIRRMLNNSIMINLLDTHPPFQIDGNFGLTAAVAEMLLQSRIGRIELLPTCPDEWQTGSIHGVIARGNIKVSIDWEPSKVSAKLLSSFPQNITVSCRGQERDVSLISNVETQIIF